MERRAGMDGPDAAGPDAARALLLDLLTHRLAAANPTTAPTAQKPPPLQGPEEKYLVAATEKVESLIAEAEAKTSPSKWRTTYHALNFTHRAAHFARRAAITSEPSDEVASSRWRSAFDALRRPEVKTPAQTAMLLATLKKIPTFGDLEPSLLLEIAAAMRSKSAAAGDAIITQGEVGDDWYLVAAGELSAFESGSGDAAVATFRAGDTFGELALLYDCPRQATVRCTTDVTLFHLGRIHFRNLVSEAMSKNSAALSKLLVKVELIAGLGAEATQQLADAMEVLGLGAGDALAEAGAPLDALYVILSGEVAVAATSDSSSLRIGEGGVVGEEVPGR